MTGADREHVWPGVGHPERFCLVLGFLTTAGSVLTPECPSAARLLLRFFLPHR